MVTRFLHSWEDAIPIISMSSSASERLWVGTQSQSEFYVFLEGSIQHLEDLPNPIISLQKLCQGSEETYFQASNDPNEVKIYLDFGNSLPQIHESSPTIIQHFNDMMLSQSQFTLNSFYQILAFGTRRQMMKLRFETVIPKSKFSLIRVGADVNPPKKARFPTYVADPSGKIIILGVNGPSDPNLFPICYNIALKFGESVQVSIAGTLYRLQAEITNEFKFLTGTAVSDGSAFWVNFSSLRRAEDHVEEYQGVFEKIANFESQLHDMRSELHGIVSREVGKFVSDIQKILSPPCSPRSPRPVSTTSRKPLFNLSKKEKTAYYSNRMQATQVVQMSDNDSEDEASSRGTAHRETEELRRSDSTPACSNMYSLRNQISREFSHPENVSEEDFVSYSQEKSKSLAEEIPQKTQQRSDSDIGRSQSTVYPPYPVGMSSKENSLSDMKINHQRKTTSSKQSNPQSTFSKAPRKQRPPDPPPADATQKDRNNYVIRPESTAPPPHSKNQPLSKNQVSSSTQPRNPAPIPPKNIPPMSTEMPPPSVKPEIPTPIKVEFQKKSFMEESESAVKSVSFTYPRNPFDDSITHSPHIDPPSTVIFDDDDPSMETKMLLEKLNLQ